MMLRILLIKIGGNEFQTIASDGKVLPLNWGEKSTKELLKSKKYSGESVDCEMDASIYILSNFSFISGN